MNNITLPRNLRPRQQPARDMQSVRHGNHPIIHAAFACFVRASNVVVGASSNQIAEELWPNDKIAQSIINKADASPLDTTGAAAIVGTSVADFFTGLPDSAGAKLISAGLILPLEGQGSITIPRRNSAGSAGSSVAEGSPIPVKSGDIAAATLGPSRKAGIITVLSGSLFRRSAAESIFRQILMEDASLTLDAALFATTAGDDEAMAGLLYGVTPTAAYGGGDAVAIVEDLKAMGSAIAAAGGGGRLVIIANPKQAISLALLMPNLSWPVWPCSALPAGRVIVMDPTAFASGFGSGVDIDVSKDGTIHMSDTPLEIVSGTGPTTADPVRSLWQTDSIGMRMLIDMAFIMRGAGQIQYADVSW